MDFVASLPSFNRDHDAKTVYGWLASYFQDTDAVCFYKYPFVGSVGTPDLVFVSRIYQPIVVKCFDYQFSDVKMVNLSSWTLAESRDNLDVEPPDFVAEDLTVELKSRFNRVRQLRDRLSPVAIAALPRLTESEFFYAFGLPKHGVFIWAGAINASAAIRKLDKPLSEDEWKLTRSILQTALPLTRNPGAAVKKTDGLGAAIRMLDSNIALLDDQQMKVAIQIPPGPQRIRGLAGTGKTVLLAMKAANIHKQFPDKRILFTFNTQSLYNQARNLITRFYRFYSDVDPNWENLHVRHAWGSRSRPGVYYDLTQRQGADYLNFSSARLLDSDVPFRACCKAASSEKVNPYYDYILVDEAQDFPKDFFPLLYDLAKAPKPIYWAYDELQTLASLEMPSTSELFGKNANGTPRVSLENPEEDSMDRDLVLNRSYRCPREILMLAHALGLGIHNPRGPVQMLSDETSWHAVGYEMQSGSLRTGEKVVLHRPKENSPTLITEIYTGNEQLIQDQTFSSRDEELLWIADSIKDNVHEQAVPPENIVVISLDSIRAKSYMMALQRLLIERNVGSTIPGLVDSASDFAETGLVTLSTVFRAKGNEAPIVYILAFEYLYSFAEEIENRNKAFTAISRTKGWVRITGSGPRMKDVQAELNKIKADLPYFKFIFPDMARLKKLDASETTRRREQVKAVKNAVGNLVSSKEAISDLSDKERAALLQLLSELQK